MNDQRFRAHVTRVVLASTLVVAAAMLAPLAQGVASATTAATATIGAGTLSVSVPANIAFSDTLSGVDQTVTAVLAIDVKDATGSGAGWDLQATSTQFTTGGNTLPTNSVTIATAPSSPTCDTGATCTLASNGVSYPYVLPAGVTAPPASKFFDAAASTGMGDQTVTPTFSLAVPANTLGGTYNSTWTISVVSGP